MTNSEKKRIQETFGQVITRCWSDESFKSRLVANPIAAIKEVAPSFSIAKGKTLVVRDQTSDDTLYINIPAQAEVSNMELTDSQLEAVAGGRCLPYNYKHVFNTFINCFSLR